MFDTRDLAVEAPRLRKFALKLTGAQHDADDLVQSTLLRAMEKNHLFETGSDLWKWLSKMMYNLFVSNYRRTVRWQCQFDPQEVIDRCAEEGIQEHRMELRLVGRALEQLPVDRRDVLVLVCVQGLSYEEVASKLGIPVGTVRSRLSRARAQLIDVLNAKNKGDDSLEGKSEHRAKGAVGDMKAARTNKKNKAAEKRQIRQSRTIESSRLCA